MQLPYLCPTSVLTCCESLSSTPLLPHRTWRVLISKIPTFSANGQSRNLLVGQGFSNSLDPGRVQLSIKNHPERLSDESGYLFILSYFLSLLGMTCHTCQCPSSQTIYSSPASHPPILPRQCSVLLSVLAWRIPGTGEPGGLPSMGSHRVGHDCSDLATAAAVPYQKLQLLLLLSLSLPWLQLSAGPSNPAPWPFTSSPL